MTLIKLFVLFKITLCVAGLTDDLLIYHGAEISSVKTVPCPSIDFQNIDSITQKVTIPSHILNWSSGATNPKMFKLSFHSNYFQNLFEVIRKNYPDIHISPLDLFHGHLIKTENDFILVFHAMEYPVDLEPQKFLEAKIFGLNLIPFLSTSPSFKKRNLIWSCKENTIWRIDTSLRSPFNYLVRSPLYDLYAEEVLKANAIYETNLGNRLFDINFLNGMLFITE